METKVIPPAMTARTVAPAARERAKFLREGVMAASATKGLARIAAEEAMRAACMTAALLDCWGLALRMRN